MNKQDKDQEEKDRNAQVAALILFLAFLGVLVGFIVSQVNYK